MLLIFAGIAQAICSRSEMISLYSYGDAQRNVMTAANLVGDVTDIFRIDAIDGAARSARSSAVDTPAFMPRAAG